MPRIGPHVPLAAQAQAFADTHAEAAEIIGALLERIDGLNGAIRRNDFTVADWEDAIDHLDLSDLNPLPGEPHEHEQ